MEQTETPDYSAFQELDETSSMARLTTLAREQLTREAALAEAERQVILKRQALEEISFKQLPELMDSLGMEEFTLTDGRKIGIEEHVRASIPEEKQRDTFEWFREIGNGKMIKRALGVQLAMGQDELADKVKKLLAECSLDVTDKQSIHNSTLVAFVRRRLKAGEEVPLDKISVFRQRASKVVEPK